MKLSQLGGKFLIADLCVLNIGKSTDHGWMVSTRKEGMGFCIFYGPDLDETVSRALKGGPQLPEPIELDDDAADLL